MAKKRSHSVRRKPRADAARNRERILEVAKQAFTRSGADTSLDEIAKQAGGGPARCIATSQRAKNFLRRFTGLRWNN
jgi:hypothetical protein